MAFIDKLRVGLYEDANGYPRAQEFVNGEDNGRFYKVLTMREAGQIALWSDYNDWFEYPKWFPDPAPEFSKNTEYVLIVVAWSDGKNTMEKAKYDKDAPEDRKWLIDGNHPVGDQGVVTHWRYLPPFPREYEED